MKNPSRAEPRAHSEKRFLFIHVAMLPGISTRRQKFVPGWYLAGGGSDIRGVQPRRRAPADINIPPRYGKSTAASIAFVAWHLGHHPEARIICVSYAQDFAEKLALDYMSVMSSKMVQGDFPDSTV